MANDTFYKFDQAALEKLITQIAAFVVAKHGTDRLMTVVEGQKLAQLVNTDNITLVFNSDPQDHVSYFSLGTGATETNTIAQDKVVTALNSLMGYVMGVIDNIDISDAYNGVINLVSGVYVGSGNAVPATDLDDIFNVLLTAINGKQEALNFDSTPISGSGNVVTSGGIYTAIANAIAGITGVSFHTCTSTEYSSSKSITGDGTTNVYTIPAKPAKLNTVTINGAETVDYTYTKSNGTITFVAAPEDNSNVVVSYDPMPDISVITTPSASTFYLVPNSNSDNDVYDEFVYISGAFERIGSTNVDLSGYVRYEDLDEITAEEIEEMFEAAFNPGA